MKLYTVGLYCGEQTGQSSVVAGDAVEITFFSDSSAHGRGFLLLFTVVPVG